MLNVANCGQMLSEGCSIIWDHDVTNKQILIFFTNLHYGGTRF